MVASNKKNQSDMIVDYLGELGYSKVTQLPNAKYGEPSGRDPYSVTLWKRDDQGISVAVETDEPFLCALTLELERKFFDHSNKDVQISVEYLRKILCAMTHYDGPRIPPRST